ncbi:hypothetical protein FACS1894147_04760 [Spirochaetia bacterium]|nr:hypothetical protein FACS1894147_04760 [Spirochaetia bacterium]
MFSTSITIKYRPGKRLKVASVLAKSKLRDNHEKHETHETHEKKIDISKHNFVLFVSFRG